MTREQKLTAINAIKLVKQEKGRLTLVDVYRAISRIPEPEPPLTKRLWVRLNDFLDRQTQNKKRHREDK